MRQSSIFRESLEAIVNSYPDLAKVMTFYEIQQTDITRLADKLLFYAVLVNNPKLIFNLLNNYQSDTTVKVNVTIRPIGKIKYDAFQLATWLKHTKCADIISEHRAALIDATKGSLSFEYHNDFVS